MNTTHSDDWSESDLQTFLKYLLNHTVAIAGTYRHTRGDARQERAYAYSGCVVASKSHWHVLTAGHAIQDHIRDTSTDGIQITGRVLADCFGHTAPHNAPIPFDPVTRIDHFQYDEGGLDYAVFTLNDNECKLLQENGIKTFPFRDKPLSATSFDRHFIVGFPDEHTRSESSTTQAGVGLQPDCVPVRPLADCAQANGRLAFEIVDKGELQSVVGLSGGPVFGINHDGDQLLVYLVAIQSAWDKDSTAFACSIEDVFNDWKQHLESQISNR